MTPFFGIPDPDDRPARLRRDAADRRLARQARLRTPRRPGDICVAAPGNDAA